MRKNIINLLKDPVMIFGFISLIIFLNIHFNNDYNTYKDRKCIVLDKMESSGRYSSKFILILKEERGIVFDLYTSPATFSQSKIGEVKYFRLRDFDIQKSFKENVIYVFLYIITGTISFVFFIGYICLYIIEKIYWFFNGKKDI